MIFGNTEECRLFWDIVKKKVKEVYKIEIKDEEYVNLTHGYLLKTILDHCGFEIALNTNLLLFTVQEPFSTSDWIDFKSKCESYTFPSMEIYKKVKFTDSTPKDEIITKFELKIYLDRVLGQNDSYNMTELSLYVPKINPPKDKISLETINYYIYRPSKENFELAYEVCTFLMPSDHPIFQDIYLSYAKAPDLNPVIFKKAAENHAIRTLGLTHWKTSSILASFK